MEIWKSDGNNELVGGGDWNMIFIVPYMLVMYGNVIIPIGFYMFQRVENTTNQSW